MEQPVEFTSDGLQLYGILNAPAGATRGVVLVHGWSGYRIGPHRMLVEMARRLAAKGIASLRFDLRGRGDSEGDEFTTNLDGMIADTMNAVKCLRERANVTRFGALGICSGSNVAIGAATLEQEIGELMLWSALPFQPEAQARTGDRTRRTRFYALEYAAKIFRAETWRKFFGGRINFGAVRRVMFGARHDRDHRNLKDSRRNVMAAFAHFRGHALFINGDRDPDAAGAREVFIPFCRDHQIDAEFHLLEGANHSFYSLEQTERVLSLTLDWYLRVTHTHPAAGGAK